MSVTATPHTRQVMMMSQLRANSANPYSACPQLPKLSKDQLDKSVERLHKVRPLPKDPEPLLKKTVVSKTRLEDSITRLYNQALDKDKAKRETRLSQLSPTGNGKTLTSDELDESLQRVFHQALRTKETTKATLAAKYTVEPPSKKLEKEQEKEANIRLYSKPMENNKERDQKLHDKYIANTLRQCPVRSDKQWSNTIERLAAK